MPAKRIEGRAVASRIRDEVRKRALALEAIGTSPHLVALQVGSHPESVSYVGSQERLARLTAIRFSKQTLPERSTDETVARAIRALNADPAVHGVFLPVPLPAGLDVGRLQAEIAPEKDVEGITPKSVGDLVCGRPANVPCTAAAVLELLDAERVPLEGTEAVVVGHSAIVGKPVALLLLDRLATVTVCHVGTRDLATQTRRADVLVVAVGRPKLVTADMIRPGAVVIDVGTTLVPGADGKAVLAGDVDPDGASRVAGSLTPVPGGVGAVTVAILMRNVVHAAECAIRSRR